MSTVMKWYGYGISDGTTISSGAGSDGDTPVSSVTGAAPVLDTEQSVTPALNFSFDGSNPAYIQWGLGQTYTNARFAFWLKTPTAWPSAAAPIFTLVDSTQTGNAQFPAGFAVAGSASPGQLRTTNNAGGYGAGSNTNQVELDTWYRVDVAINQTEGTAHWWLYSADGSTLLAAVPNSGPEAGNYGAQYDGVILGQWTNVRDWDGSFALLKVTDEVDTPIGLPSQTNYGTGVFIYNGIDEVAVGGGGGGASFDPRVFYDNGWPTARPEDNGKPLEWNDTADALAGGVNTSGPDSSLLVEGDYWDTYRFEEV